MLLFVFKIFRIVQCLRMRKILVFGISREFRRQITSVLTVVSDKRLSQQPWVTSKQQWRRLPNGSAKKPPATDGPPLQQQVGKTPLPLVHFQKTSRSLALNLGETPFFLGGRFKSPFGLIRISVKDAEEKREIYLRWKTDMMYLKRICFFSSFYSAELIMMGLNYFNFLK